MLMLLMFECGYYILTLKSKVKWSEANVTVDGGLKSRSMDYYESCSVRALAVKVVQKNGEIVGSVTSRQSCAVWDNQKYRSKGG
jgi:hypothetical protein